MFSYANRDIGAIFNELVNGFGSERVWAVGGNAQFYNSEDKGMSG